MDYIVEIRGDEKNLEITWDLIHFLALQHGMAEIDADVYAVAVGEAYSNGIQYSPGHSCKLVLKFNPEKFMALVINNGQPVDFKNIEAFDCEQDFMQYKNGKLGIPMIKKLVDKVNYSYENGENKLKLVKFIKNININSKGEHDENY